MSPLPVAVRKWARRLIAALLLPLAVAAADLVITPTPHASLALGPGERAVHVSADGSTLVTHDGRPWSGWDPPEPGTLRVWDLRTGRRGPQLEDAADVVIDWDHEEFLLSPDARLIAAKARDDLLKTWDATSGEKLGQLKLSGAGVRLDCLSFTPDGRFVVLERSGTEPPFAEHGVEFRDADLRQVRAALPGHRPYGKVWSLQWSADGRRFATVHKKTVILHELADADPVVRPVVEHAVSGEPVFSPDLGVFATLDHPASRDAVLTLRDTETGAVLAAELPFDSEARLVWLTLDRDCRRLTCVGHTPDVFPRSGTTTRTDYDLDSGARTLHRFRDDSDHLSPRHVWSPDQRWMAERLDGAIDLWDTSAGENRGWLRHAGDSRDDVPRAQFSKDTRFVLATGLHGKTAATVSFDFRSGPSPLRMTGSGPVARLWHVEGRREVCAFPGCTAALLSEDGKTLVTVHEDGEVKVWDMPPPRPWRTVLAVGVVFWVLLLAAGLALRRAWRWLRTPSRA